MLRSDTQKSAKKVAFTA